MKNLSRVLVLIIVFCIGPNVKGMRSHLVSPIKSYFGKSTFLIPENTLVINDRGTIRYFSCPNTELLLRVLSSEIYKVNESERMKFSNHEGLSEENLISILSNVMKVAQDAGQENIDKNIENKTPKFLFFLRSALEFKCCNQEIIDIVSDKLIQNEDIYYQESPYYIELQEISNIGIHNSKALFTQKNLNRMSNVLCFSKIDANSNKRSKETFEEWKKLSMIC